MSPSRLVDGSPLVLDASACLNLLGTGRAAELLRILPNEAAITETAAGEIGRDPLRDAPGSVALGELAATGLLRAVPLSAAAYNHYLSLVGAPSPDGLDDGEAATVAHAADTGAVPVIDEKKATRIAGPLCLLAPVCTLDLLSHPLVLAELGEAGAADAVHSALLRARMRVPESFRSWTVRLIGAERLRACSSIPKRWLEAPAAEGGGQPVRKARG